MNYGINFILYLSVFLNICIGKSDAESLTPENVFDKVSKSVVIIDDMGSVGSGVVISSNGYILTKYHVVSSGLPLTITLKVLNDGKIEEKVFKDVNIHKVHLDYSLALIKLDLKEVKAFPISKLSETSNLEIASTCYIVGDPEDLQNNITEGLISNAAKEKDGLKYVEYSAVINPGNSGGAVCDDLGQLIGIATWKLGDPEKIAYAIPISQLNMKDFVYLPKREGRFDLGVKIEEEATKIFNQAKMQRKSLSPRDYKLMIIYASHLYKKSLLYMPEKSSPYRNIGSMYYEIEKYELALEYFKKAQEISPHKALIMNMLGLTQEKLKNSVAAEKYWLYGILDEKDPQSASSCAENFARYKFRIKEFAAAAYLLKWADSLHDGNNDAKSIRLDYNELSLSKISDEQFKYLNKKGIKFSKEDLAHYLELEENSNDTSSEEGHDPVIVMNSKYNSKEIILDKQRQLIDLPEEGLKIRLPGLAGKVMTSLAGSQLLIHFPDFKKIGVFDLATAKFIYFLDTKEKNILITAGGSNLLLYLPISKTFEVWNMKTWKRTKIYKDRSSHPLLQMAMSMHNSSRVLILRSKGTTKEQLCYFSLNSGETVYPEIVVQTRANSSSFNSLAYSLKRAESSLDHNLSICETGSIASFYVPSNSSIYFKLETNKITIIPTTSSEGNLSYDGEFAFSQNSVVEVESGDKVGEHRKKEFNYIISMGAVSGQQSLALFGTLDSTKAYTMSLQNLPSFLPVKNFDLSVYELDSRSPHHIFASSYVSRYGLVTADKKNLIMVGLSKKEIAEQAMKPGGVFTRKLTIPEGVKVSVDSGPKGLIYDEKTTSIKWDIPVRLKRGTEYTIILLLTDAKGEEDFVVEKIQIP